MKRSITRLTFAATLLAAPFAHAVSVAPGTTAALPGTTAAAEGNLAGLIVADVLTPFSINGINSNTGGAVDITGTVQNRVVKSVDGTYDFYWRVIVDATSSEAIGSFRIGDFGAPTADYNVNYRVDGLGTLGPDAVHRFTNATPGAVASFYNFVFSNGLAPGSESNFMFMDTDALNYGLTAVYDLANIGQNPISAQFAAFGPAAVPVPAALPLLLSGLATLGWRRRQTSA
ncbi:MAG: PEP-CTERM sorting domain-containing protein [Gammaproteobacteria bacterium]|nr:PEP-CTERM sorting domain-containing protein [Gammaproteobacteria bacterium]MBI5617823.1 PEP-CTERM sorting domain-containing protein [Gammaproteobacteria bacterium]